MLETLLGTLYLAGFVARLVSMSPGRRSEGAACAAAPRLAYDRRSSRRAFTNFVFVASSTLGYCKPSDQSVSITAAATTRRVNHLLSAGTTYHGAWSAAVLRIASS